MFSLHSAFVRARYFQIKVKMSEALNVPTSNSYFDKSPVHTPTTLLKSLDLLSVEGTIYPVSGPSSPCSENSSNVTTPVRYKTVKSNPEDEERRKSLVSDLCYEQSISDEFSHIQLSIKERRVSMGNGDDATTFHSLNAFNRKGLKADTENKFIVTKIINDDDEIEIIDLDDDDDDRDRSHSPILLKQNYYPNCDVNVWLRSCEHEIIEPMNGTLSGSIPRWINGCLLRNGPGSIKVGSMTFNHLFDSSALLHRFNIENGSVTYQCRFLKTDSYKKNLAANRVVVSEFGTACAPDPCQSIFQR